MMMDNDILLEIEKAKLEQAKINLEAERVRLQTESLVTQADKDVTRIKYDRIFASETIIGICISLLIVCGLSAICYGCNRTTNLHYVLNSHGYELVGPPGGPQYIQPLTPK